MNTTEQEVATKATIEEKNTPKKKLDTGILNSFISDLAWENDTKKMDSLKQVYLSFSPEEKEFIDKNAVREGANSIEEVFEKVLPKDAKEKLENKINNFLNTVKQMETTEQKGIPNDVTVDRVTDVTNQLTEKQFTQLNYLKNQVKYLGLGEDPKMHKDLENAILSP